MDKIELGAISTVLVALLGGPVTMWIKRRPIIERRKPVTKGEIDALETTVTALKTTVEHQDHQIRQLLKEQNEMGRDIEDLRSVSRRMSKEVHMYRAAVAIFITAHPEHAQWWDERRTKIDNDMLVDHIERR